MSRARRYAARGLRRQAGSGFLIALLAVALWGSSAAGAGSAPPGAAACSGCHSPAAGTGSMPSLSGKTAADIAQDMRAFKSGAREATVMDRIAKGFSDEEIQAIADWLAANRGAATARSAKP